MKNEEKMNKEIKNLIEKAIERKIEKMLEFNWQRIIGEE